MEGPPRGTRATGGLYQFGETLTGNGVPGRRRRAILQRMAENSSPFFPRLGFLFAGLGVACLALAAMQGGIWWLVGWLGFNFLLVGTGYLGLGARIFGKTSAGRLPLFTKMVFAPYLLYVLLIWHLARLLSREHTVDRVTDGIVVGRRLLASELIGEFDVIVDLTSEFQEPAGIRHRPGYVSFPILDAAAPSPRLLREVITALPAGTVFIHCAQGHGRTGLFALALLLHRREVASIDEGLVLLKTVRPGIELSRAQMKCIEGY